MKHLCVIGNSHLAAIRLGWDRIPESERPISLDFYASRSETLARTRVEGGVLTSSDPVVLKSFRLTGGTSEIDLGRYDGFLLVGGGVHVKHLTRLFSRTTMYPHVDYSLRLVSHALLADASEAFVRKTAMSHVMREISRTRDTPIHVMAEPFFCRRVVEMEGDAPIVAVHDRGFGADYAEIFDAACQKAFSERANFLPQPAETREDFVFTAPRYSVGASGLRRMLKPNREANPHDINHKNAEYGEAALRAFFAKVG